MCYPQELLSIISGQRSFYVGVKRLTVLFGLCHEKVTNFNRQNMHDNMVLVEYNHLHSVPIHIKMNMEILIFLITVRDVLTQNELK